MARWKLLALAGTGTFGAFALMAAQQPGALSQTQSGLWEISGAPGTRLPIRQCVTNVAALAKFEHRGRPCKLNVTTDGPSSTVFEYNCGAAGFGHSQVDVITPRSLRIQTQGISNQLPFSYVLQARRVGDCPVHQVAPASTPVH